MDSCHYCGKEVTVTGYGDEQVSRGCQLGLYPTLRMPAVVCNKCIDRMQVYAKGTVLEDAKGVFFALNNIRDYHDRLCNNACNNSEGQKVVLDIKL
jgi:hypothetical protein